MKLGKLEKEVLKYLDNNKDNHISFSDIGSKFARFTRNAGDRTGHSNYSQISHLLERLVNKGLIKIENCGRTDNKVIRTNQNY